MGRLFGTDGVRGIANEDLTNELAMKIGSAAATVLLEESKSAKPTVLIGKDTRASGDMLEAALTAGLCSFCRRCSDSCRCLSGWAVSV